MCYLWWLEDTKQCRKRRIVLQLSQRSITKRRWSNSFQTLPGLHNHPRGPDPTRLHDRSRNRYSPHGSYPRESLRQEERRANRPNDPPFRKQNQSWRLPIRRRDLNVQRPRDHPERNYSVFKRLKRKNICSTQGKRASRLNIWLLIQE